MCSNQGLQCQIIKCFASSINEAPTPPALMREKQHIQGKSLGEVHGFTSKGGQMDCRVKPALIYSLSLLFHLLTAPSSIIPEFSPVLVQLNPSFCRSYINPHPSFAETTEALRAG